MFLECHIVASLVGNVSPCKAEVRRKEERMEWPNVDRLAYRHIATL